MAGWSGLPWICFPLTPRFRVREKSLKDYVKHAVSPLHGG